MNDISTDHGWNDADRRKLKYLETDLSHCCSIDHNAYMEWYGIRPGPLWWEAGNYLCHGTATAGTVHASKIGVIAIILHCWCLKYLGLFAHWKFYLKPFLPWYLLNRVQWKSNGICSWRVCALLKVMLWLQATLWLCEDYPLSLQEQIMPIVDLMAISSSHFAKLKDFIQMQLPAGFPVKIGKVFFCSVTIS